MATYSMIRGVWWTTVHRVAKSQTWLKRLSSQTQGRIIHSLRGPSAPKQSVVQRLILEMMQLLFLAARAVGFSPCLSKSRACATYLHNTDTPELLWMVGGNVNSTWKTVQQYGGSSNIKKRTCIGSQSLTSDYIPKGSRISIFLKCLFILLPWALLRITRSFLHHAGPFILAGGSGVCLLCLCGTWA